MLTVNGQQKPVPTLDLHSYLLAEGYLLDRVAVEHNGHIVPKNRYRDTTLTDGDRLEIVHFMGGG